MPDAIEFLLGDGLDLACEALLEFLRAFRNLVKIVIAFRGDLGPNGMDFFNNGIFEHLQLSAEFFAVGAPAGTPTAKSVLSIGHCTGKHGRIPRRSRNLAAAWRSIAVLPSS